MNTKIISIANHKGGVGKTTSVACIGLALARKGKRVLIVDLDAQANLTSFFLPDETEEEARKSVYDSLTASTPLPLYDVAENLQLCPSSLDMATIELALSGRMAREMIIRDLLAPIKANYDYILLDCPPSLGVITTNAFVASTDIYIPLTAEALPLKGMKMLDDVVDAVRRINGDTKITGVFFTRYNNRSLNKIVHDAVAQNYGDVLFKTKIRENISVAETPAAGGDIFEYAPTSNGAVDYMALTDEILNR